MPVELRHKRLAEPHNLAVALPSRVKVAPALRAPDRQARQAVFKGLFEPQKLHDRQVHARMKPQSALVRPDRPVELHAIPTVGLHPARVVHPGHPERDRPLRLRHPLQQSACLIFRMLVYHRFQRGIHLFHRLQKLRLVAILFLYVFQYPLNIGVHACPPDMLKMCDVWESAQAHHSPAIWQSQRPGPQYIKYFSCACYFLSIRTKSDRPQQKSNAFT
ncbi:hypothetical protein SDC9_133138 [bioreactor metagenome]|uniref:Uncharacterized protein n=1 Tax=bioreactor metagenome TaxID=1076179 RepID=A0A645DA10_9ZZZZ